MKFWVQGRGREEYFRWYSRDLSESELEEESDEWARGTSIGRVAEYYRWGWEEVEALPDYVVKELKDSSLASIRFAEARLKALEEVKSFEGCRYNYGCYNEAVTTRVREEASLLRKEGKALPTCEACAKTHDIHAKSYAKLRKERGIDDGMGEP